MKRTTMKDVAKQAGVSNATVSHVINGTRYVKEGTKTRVLQAITDLDYRPNAAARSLTTRRTGIIGVVISDATNLFFSEMLAGVENVIRDKNYGLVVCNTNEILEYEDHYLNLLLDQRVDGIIAAAASKRWSALAMAEVQHTPVVFVDRAYENLEKPFVGVDNQGGAAQGTHYLIQQGHCEIGILAGLQRLSTMRERVVGFHQALAESNLDCPDDWVVTSELSIEAGKESALEILSQAKRPTALFASNNLLCLGTLLALRELGLRCPDDVSLVSFDEHPWASVADPPLTVVRQPARQVGQCAAQMLCDFLGDTTSLQARIILPCELVERQSVAKLN